MSDTNKLAQYILHPGIDVSSDVPVKSLWAHRRLAGRSSTLAVVAMSMFLGLSGCQSPSMPPPPAPASMPTPPTPPSSQPPAPPSAPSSPSSQPPSPPSPPSSAPPSAAPPAAPSPSSPSESSTDSSAKPPAGQQSESSSDSEQKSAEEKAASRQSAADDLREQGQQVSDAAGELGSSTPPGNPTDGSPENMSPESGNEPPDPMMPDDPSAGAAGDVFSDAVDTPASNDMGESGNDGPAGDNPSDSAAEAAGGLEQENAEAGSGDSTSAALEAAKVALEEAGMAIGTAADAVSGANSDEALAAAEDALADARVAVVIAGQDLSQARQVMAESGAPGTSAGESNIDAAEAALANATLAIVVATGAIMDAAAEFPGDAQRLPSGGVITNTQGTGQGSELDEELEASLIIFDGRIEESRQAVLSPGVPSTRTGLPARQPRNQQDSAGNQDSGDEGNGIDMATSGEATDAQDDIPPQTDAKSSGTGQGATQTAKAQGTTDMLPADIDDGQGDDIVAQQLREAALAETDAALQEKLWEEYRRYKSGS